MTSAISGMTSAIFRVMGMQAPRRPGIFPVRQGKYPGPSNNKILDSG